MAKKRNIPGGSPPLQKTLDPAAVDLLSIWLKHKLSMEKQKDRDALLGPDTQRVVAPPKEK